MTDPDRQLTAGERNAQRRRERAAAKREQAIEAGQRGSASSTRGAGVPKGRSGAGKRGTGSGSSSSGTGKRGAAGGEAGADTGAGGRRAAGMGKRGAATSKSGFGAWGRATTTGSTRSGRDADGRRVAGRDGNARPGAGAAGRGVAEGGSAGRGGARSGSTERSGAAARGVTDGAVEGRTTRGVTEGGAGRGGAGRSGAEGGAGRGSAARGVAGRGSAEGGAGRSGAGAGRSGAGRSGAEGGSAARGGAKERSGDAKRRPAAVEALVESTSSVELPPSQDAGQAISAPVVRTEKKRHRHKVATPAKPVDDVYRAGFACFVGRPNAGKSTLTNAIIGQKIAITSNKPQTTRHVIRGVLHKENAQLVLVDTPGLHRPKTLLGERLNDLVRETWSETDVIGICFPADEAVGAGDRFISAEMAELKATVIAVVTKVDLVGPAVLAERLLAVSKLYDFADIVPVSAVSGHQVDNLVDVLVSHLPESPALYPDDVLTEEPEQVLIGELIREAALEGVRDELPHSIAVLVDEMIVEGNTTKIYANLYVERDSQKSIVIGTKGARLKDVGTRARAEIEALLGRKIYLDLHIRVAKEWQRDPKLLRRLGF
ncbi:hypothetical protein GCM10010435_34680 [Winogradskya consettensis]|uniref:GTPase Era n=1 Tax=Winogradskya consettensis TaxID=113560 RepID=A0A919SL14_9ACTN|nr:hypothetical protein Aco04nite_40000 [Actinoplanes consettensis]